MSEYVFKNSILLSKREISIDVKNLKKEKIGDFLLLKDSNVPLIKFNNILLYGWTWNCKEGRKVVEKDLEFLTFDNVIEKTKDFSGRYIIIIDFKYLFTDATSLFPIYYTNEMFSTNMSLLCKVNKIEIKPHSEYRKKLILPPSTSIANVKRLIPGEYLDLKCMKSSTIDNYITLDKKDTDIKHHIEEISNYLITCGKGLNELCKSDYRLMFTGGKDSRLSFLAMYQTVSSKVQTLTHSKPYFFDTPHDIKSPKEISKILNFSHQLTRAKKTNLKLAELEEHAPVLSLEREPGSTYFYYKHGNWEHVKERFVIDNYYEIGRMHLYGKGTIGNSSKLTYELLIENNYIINEDDFRKLENHIKKISENGADKLDVFYFIKNYINVGNQFEMIDYSHNPLCYCNSLNLFRMLLSIPEEYRANSRFHNLLIEKMNITKINHISCNPNATSFRFRLVNKLKSIIMSKVYK